MSLSKSPKKVAQMLKLRQDKTFIKDLQKARLGDSQLGKFTAFITALMRGESLPPEARDHALVGEWQGYREFHIGGDKLVIYKIKADELLLARLGTHTQLFKGE